MRSAVRAVCRRWAMMIVVRWRETCCIASATRASVARSRFDVASSSRRMTGSTSSARARAMSWRCPEESERPRSEELVQVPTGQLGDEVVGADGAGRRLHLVVARVGSAVGDVVADGAGEEEGLLGDVAELAAVAEEIERAEVEAVDAHRALVGIVEAGQQLHHRRLAGPRLAHERHRLARLDVQVDAAQRLRRPGQRGVGAPAGSGGPSGPPVAIRLLRPTVRRRTGIGEADVVEGDLAAQPARHDRLGRPAG